MCDDTVRRPARTSPVSVWSVHLLEMTRASGVDARLSMSSIPLLAGAAETAQSGLLSSLHPQNVRLRRAVANHDAVRSAPAYPLLFDPQTAGGLLASLPAEQAESCLTELRTHGYPDATEVGAIAPQSDPDAPITVEM